MKKRTYLYGGLLVSAMLLTGCGSNEKADGNVVTNGEASMSILLEGEVKLDNTRGCMKYFLVHAVDGNGNPIPNLSIDANIVVTAKASGSSVGTIETTAPISFVDGRYDFNAKQVTPGDKLIVLPTQSRNEPAYLGDWTISKVNGNRVEVLGAAYNLETTDQLSYVIGNESAYVSGYGNAVAHVEKADSNGTELTNDDGYAGFYVLYDLALINHTIAVGVHSGDGYRLGAAAIGNLPDCTVTTDNNDTNNTGN